MRAHAAKLVVEFAQVFTRTSDHPHAEIAMAAKKLVKFLTRNESQHRVDTRFGRHSVRSSGHALTQPERGFWADHFQKLQLALPSR